MLYVAIFIFICDNTDPVFPLDAMVAVFGMHPTGPSGTVPLQVQYPFRCEDRSKIPDELLEGRQLWVQWWLSGIEASEQCQNPCWLMISLAIILPNILGIMIIQ